MSNDIILKSVKLLFIEDDDIQRSELTTFLKRRFDKIYSAKNGEEGYEKYLSLKPDMILTDLRMPKVDGLELVKKIREKDRIIPIIIITAMNDKETILRSVDLGISNYVVKPVNVKELLTVLEETALTLMDIKGDDFGDIVEKEKINELKNELTKYIKSETGKGPSDIRIKMTNRNWEINFIDILTLFEKNMINKSGNIPLVDHNRNIFFRDRQSELELLLSDKLGLSLKLFDVKSNSEESECKLHFKLN